MVAFQSSNIVVHTIVYMLTALLVATSDLIVKDSAANSGSEQSNLLDIHLETPFEGTSLKIKSFTRNGIKDCNKRIDTLTSNKLEENNSIAEFSAGDQEKLKLDSRLNRISTQLQSFEELLQNMQTGESRKSSGVHCNSCILSSQNQSSHYPKNCKEVLKSGNKTTGIYEIYPINAKEPFPVLCDMDIKGGGWTHIQKRFDGSQDFFLEWRNYKFGFGDLDGEFWLGLEQIYILTDGEPCELLVEIVDRDNISAHAHYSSFGIGPEKNGYPLDRLTGFSGDAGDSLSIHRERKFSTKDLDFTPENCATAYPGGWWYTNCHTCNLNGKFINVDLPEKLKFRGVHWSTFRSHPYCHSKSRMLIRPTN